MDLDTRVLGVLGVDDVVRRVLEEDFQDLDAKVAAMIDLKDNPAVQVAGMFGQQQPSAALPQLSEALTQLAMQQVQEEMNKSTAVNDPMEAENERLRRQKENLQLQKEIAQLQAEMQGGQQPMDPSMAQGMDPGMMGGAPAGGMPGGEMQMPPDMGAMYGAVPPPEMGAQGGGGQPQQQDTMSMLRQALGG